MTGACRSSIDLARKCGVSGRLHIGLSHFYGPFCISSHLLSSAFVSGFLTTPLVQICSLAHNSLRCLANDPSALSLISASRYSSALPLTTPPLPRICTRPIFSQPSIPSHPSISIIHKTSPLSHPLLRPHLWPFSPLVCFAPRFISESWCESTHRSGEYLQIPARTRRNGVANVHFAGCATHTSTPCRALVVPASWQCARRVRSWKGYLEFLRLRLHVYRVTRLNLLEDEDARSASAARSSILVYPGDPGGTTHYRARSERRPAADGDSFPRRQATASSRPIRFACETIGPTSSLE